MRKLLLTMAIVLAASGCGESGPPGGGNLIKTIISGNAYLLGPMADAEVSVWDFRNAEKATLFGEASTDSSGDFEVDLRSFFGDLLVEVDSKDGSLKALVTGVKAGDDVELPLTLISSLAADYAAYLFESGKFRVLHDANIRARELLYEHFGQVGQGTVPLLEDQANISEQVILGILIHSLQNRTGEMSGSSTILDLMEALSADIYADGFFNGMGRSSRQLFVGPTELSGDTLRTDFGSSIRHFLASESNPTHFTEQNLSYVINRIETSESELFDSAPSTPDRTPPEIGILEPARNDTVSGVIIVRVEASDSEGNLKEVFALKPAGMVLEEAEGLYEGLLDTTKFEDGELDLEVLARDKAGNETKDTIAVTVKNQGTLTGYVFKGFVKEATLTAYQFKPGEGMTVLARGMTDADGYYSLEIGYQQGPILIESTYGRYEEEALSIQVDVSRSEYLSAVIPNYSPSYVQNVTLSPLTTWATVLAEYFVLKEQKEPAAAAEAANQALSDHFGGVDLLSTVPVDLLSGRNCEALTDRVLYALYCAGLSQLAKQISIESDYTPGAVVNAITLSVEVASDLTDGVLDGYSGNRVLQQGVYDLSSYTLRTDLARATIEWIHSDMNPCAVQTSDFMQYANELAEDQSELFPPDDPIIPIDTEKPVITFDSHEQNEWVAGDIEVVATATDNDQLNPPDAQPPGFQITSPADLYPTIKVVSPSEHRLTFTRNTRMEADGPFVITYRAQDRSGNPTEMTGILTLQIDNTPPSVAWTDPADNATIKTDAGSIICKGTVEDSDVGVKSVKVNNKEATINGSSWSVTVPVSGDQWNTLNLEALDKLGNSNSMSRRVYINTDVQAPVINFTSHENNQWVNGTFDIVAEATDNVRLDTFEITTGLTGVLESGNAKKFILTVHDFASTGKSDGAFEIGYRAVDAAGNVTTKTLTLRIDNTPPSLTWTKPEEGEMVHGNPPVYCVRTEGTVSDTGSGFSSLHVNHVLVTPIGSSWRRDFCQIEDGSYAWRATAVDNVGNERTIVRSFTFKRM